MGQKRQCVLGNGREETEIDVVARVHGYGVQGVPGG